MQEVCLEIKLLSETIFGSGQSIPGEVDLEIVHDTNGLPYFKGKTFKGKLREELENLCALTKDNKLSEEVKIVLGEAGDNGESIFKFSDCEIKKEIRDYLVYGVRENIVTANELKEALTQTRKFTSIGENGVAHKGSLREFRVINPGLVLECNVFSIEAFTTYRLGILAVGAKMLRRIGSLESRGKGQVDIKLLVDGQDKTSYYADLLMKEVQG